MEVMRLDHVQLAMPAGQEELAPQFYGGVLGLNEVEKPPQLRARGGTWAERAGVKIHLGVDKNFRPARKAHVGLLVTDLEDRVARARVLSRGCEVEEDHAPLPGLDSVYVYDLFGNRLELMRRTDDWSPGESE